MGRGARGGEGLTPRAPDTLTPTSVAGPPVGRLVFAEHSLVDLTVLIHQVVGLLQAWGRGGGVRRMCESRCPPHPRSSPAARTPTRIRAHIPPRPTPTRPTPTKLALVLEHQEVRGGGLFHGDAEGLGGPHGLEHTLARLKVEGGGGTHGAQGVGEGVQGHG
jgi:hypothetical protein